MTENKLAELCLFNPSKKKVVYFYLLLPLFCDLWLLFRKKTTVILPDGGCFFERAVGEQKPRCFFVSWMQKSIRFAGAHHPRHRCCSPLQSEGSESHLPPQKSRSEERDFLFKPTGLIYHHTLACISSTRKASKKFCFNST